MIGPPHTLSIPVYAYKLGHVVGHQLTSRTKIKLVNVRKWHFHLLKKGGHPLTEYDIIINDPLVLDFPHVEQAGDDVMQNRIGDFILAINQPRIERNYAVPCFIRTFRICQVD
ncbi:MAG: hypothetical protein M3258_07785 [Thermoproteota archaeon]|jgi:hypothetical protein|nr:hypothetical protein [Thermoproteota archaeon]